MGITSSSGFQYWLVSTRRCYRRQYSTRFLRCDCHRTSFHVRPFPQIQVDCPSSSNASFFPIPFSSVCRLSILLYQPVAHPPFADFHETFTPKTNSTSEASYVSCLMKQTKATRSNIDGSVIFRCKVYSDCSVINNTIFSYTHHFSVF